MLKCIAVINNVCIFVKQNNLKIEKMINSIQNQVAEAVSNNVVDYFANLINSFDFSEKHISPIVTVSEEQKEKISDVLSRYSIDWDNADCDAEGLSKEQDKALDLIIQKCTEKIALIFN